MRLVALAALTACASHAGAPATDREAAEPAAPVRAAPAGDAATARPAGAAAEPSAPEPVGCIDDSAPYDPAGLRAQVAKLAAAAWDGRATGSAHDAAARAMIAERFRCLGLIPGGDDGSYEQPFSADGRATANVIGYLPGTSPERGSDVIIVGAHHDHLGNGHLGANDNASGVAALLAIAQAIRQHGPLARTVGFVAFGGEELGLVGSQYFVAHPPEPLALARVVYDVNLDMVGSYASSGTVYAMGTFRGLPATAIVKALAAQRPALRVATGGRGAGSDHDVFCRAGIPYVFFWTPDKRCYHKPCDTVERIDAAHLGQIAALAGALVIQLADSPRDLLHVRTRLGCTGR